jgi:hypothetical protein
MEIKEEQWFALFPITVDGGIQNETRWLETVRVKFQYQERYDTREFQWRALEFLPVKTPTDAPTAADSLIQAKETSE